MQDQENRLTQLVWIAEHATSPTLKKEYLEKAEKLLKRLERMQRKSKGRSKGREIK